jgi:NADPH-dependent curcumin reductase
MRGWLNNVRSYVPPVAIGEKMRGVALATVLFSRTPGIDRGDVVIAPVIPHISYLTDSQGAGWCEYSITDNITKVVPIPGGSYLDYLSVLGLTGITAYFGLLDICNPHPGETVVVSGAAGAVGMVAAQIAKIKGCRVVGIAGGAEKCQYLKEELGLDEVVDYKDENFRNALEKATPKYIDCFFDNGNPIVLVKLISSRRFGLGGMSSPGCS